MASSATRPIIVAKALTRIYTPAGGEVVGIDAVDLEIAAGDLVVLKGDSGAGKSTLLSLLAGLESPSRGQLQVAGHDLRQTSAKRLTRFRREVVGMVFQSFNLLPTLSAWENVCLPALLAGHAISESRKKALEYLDWLDLTPRRDHLPAQLSGGEMQRTAIARALINDPQLILADEPTGNLDSHNGRMVIELLAELNRRWQRTVIIATHSTLADAFATRMLHLKDGGLVGSPCKQ